MKALLAAMLAVILPLLVHAAWGADYEGALAQAKAQQKLVLLHFTRSDGSDYCKAFDKEVLSQPVFTSFAEANYVAVTLDYPHVKPQADALKQQNDTLAKQYNIEGFPTLIVINPEGRELGREVGYEPGSGADAVITKLKSFK